MTSPIIDTLKNIYDTRGDEVEKWLAELRAESPPLFYNSVDLRHSGLRLAPVDTNVFPAGFNNLSPVARERTSNHIKHFFQENYPQAKRVLIIPENHTRNLFYLENLYVLQSLFANAGMETKIGNLITPAGEILHLTSASGAEIQQYPLVKIQNKLSLENGFIPDIIIMNNDMTSGLQQILQNIIQPIIPPLHMGWFKRRKSVHFAEYKKLIENFSQKFSIDPWLLDAQSHKCGMVDFNDKNSLECLAKSIDEIITFSQKKHSEYGISQEPYVYIKADAGTYGMGIITVKSPDEVMELNKKKRNQMQVIKEGTIVSEVIIQEGIPTIDTVENAPAEPMVYMIDGVAVGGMYRVNNLRDNLGNLNATGMHFSGMCDESESENGTWHKVNNCDFRAYGIIASIAALAAGREKY
ncbi:MAG: glutamate--cysteine ligase [Rickettsiales bacterium]